MSLQIFSVASTSDLNFFYIYIYIYMCCIKIGSNLVLIIFFDFFFFPPTVIVSGWYLAYSAISAVCQAFQRNSEVSLYIMLRLLK